MIALSALHDTKRFSVQAEGKRALKEVLRDLQDHYKVSIVYEDGITSGKMVQGSVRFLPDFEATAEELLRPLGLQAKKVNNRTYAISPIKESGRKLQNSVPDPVPANDAHLPQPRSTRDVGLSMVAASLYSVSGIVTDKDGFPLP